MTDIKMKIKINYEEAQKYLLEMEYIFNTFQITPDENELKIIKRHAIDLISYKVVPNQ